MEARPLLLTKSPLNKSPLNKSPKRMLGKGGSQISVPRLTGKGGILVAELSYIITRKRADPAYDYRKDDYRHRFIFGEIYFAHYVVTGLMIYGLLLSDKNGDGFYDFYRHIMDPVEFEKKDLDGGDWKDHPKEFIIYFFRKLTNSQEPKVIELIDSFEDNIDYLVKNGYLTYNPEPFTGYFTIYEPLNGEHIRRLPYGRDYMSRDDTRKDAANGYILHRMSTLGGDDIFKNCDWNEIVHIFSKAMVAEIFNLVEFGGYDEDDEDDGQGGGEDEFQALSSLEESKYMIKNLEIFIKRMIYTKYIRHQRTRQFIAKIEVEEFRF